MSREIDPRDCQDGWADVEQSEIDRLRTENAALRAALTEIAKHVDFKWGHVLDCLNVVRTAKAALGENAKPEDPYLKNLGKEQR